MIIKLFNFTCGEQKLWEKVYNFFVHDCLKIFVSDLASLKIHGNVKSNQFLVEKKEKSFHKYWPASIGATFGIKFLLNAKVLTLHKK